MAGKYTVRANNMFAAFVDGERVARKDDQDARLSAAQLEQMMISNELSRALAPETLRQAQLTNQQITAQTQAILGGESRAAQTHASQANARALASEEARQSLNWVRANEGAIAQGHSSHLGAMTAQNQAAIAGYNWQRTQYGAMEQEWKIAQEQYAAQQAIAAAAEQANPGGTMVPGVGGAVGAATSGDRPELNIRTIPRTGSNASGQPQAPMSREQSMMSHVPDATNVAPSLYRYGGEGSVGAETIGSSIAQNTYASDAAALAGQLTIGAGGNLYLPSGDMLPPDLLTAEDKASLAMSRQLNDISAAIGNSDPNLNQLVSRGFASKDPAVNKQLSSIMKEERELSRVGALPLAQQQQFLISQGVSPQQVERMMSDTSVGRMWEFTNPDGDTIYAFRRKAAQSGTIYISTEQPDLRTNR